MIVHSSGGAMARRGPRGGGVAKRERILRAAVRIFIRNHMDLLTREAGLIEVIQVELRQSKKFMKEYVPVKFLEYLDVISGILEDGKREGVFRPDLNVTLARRAIV